MAVFTGGGTFTRGLGVLLDKCLCRAWGGVRRCCRVEAEGPANVNASDCGTYNYGMKATCQKGATAPCLLPAHFWFRVHREREFTECNIFSGSKEDGIKKDKMCACISSPCTVCRRSVWQRCMQLSQRTNAACSSSKGRGL